ncbi:MAG: hypothetical protein VB140_00585 [Burkholderia sp.]
MRVNVNESGSIYATTPCSRVVQASRNTCRQAVRPLLKLVPGSKFSRASFVNAYTSASGRHRRLPLLWKPTAPDDPGLHVFYETLYKRYLYAQPRSKLRQERRDVAVAYEAV